MESLQREGRPGTVPDESFDSLSVIAQDADGSIDAEPTRSPPVEHAVGVGLVEEAAGAEVPEHAALDDALEFVPVVGLEMGGLMEAGIAARAVRECAVEDDTVVVEVRIER